MECSASQSPEPHLSAVPRRMEPALKHAVGEGASVTTTTTPVLQGCVLTVELHPLQAEQKLQGKAHTPFEIRGKLFQSICVAVDPCAWLSLRGEQRGIASSRVDALEGSA
jgi:hypothetical protein